MESIFLQVYDFFDKRRPVFWTLFVALLFAVGLGASRIKVEEDISRFFPDDERVEKLNYVFRKARFSERMAIMVSVADSAAQPAPDSLVAYAGELAGLFESALKPYVSSVTAQVDDRRILSLYYAVQENLPLFLEEEDYAVIDSLIHPENSSKILSRNYQQLVGPAGLVNKRILVKDPAGISFLVLSKLQRLQYDTTLALYDGYLMSRDRRHLVFFVEPKHRANDTGANAPFMEALDYKIDSLGALHPSLKASYFGATSVAVGNAQQLQRDTFLTVSLMIALLGIFIIGFFRRKRVPLVILLPVLFGGLFAVACIALLQGTISIIAIGAGSIVLGIAVNYSLHFLTHLRHEGDIRATIRDLAKPMTLGSATTVLAFFCLQFVNAAVLRDVGLFAGFSLVGAALCSLLFLPQLIRGTWIQSHREPAWIERVANYSFESNGKLVLLILLLTPVFLYFAQRVTFNTDLSKMNFMQSSTEEAQRRLEHITQATLTSVYVISQGGNMEEALQRNEHATGELMRLQQRGDVQKISSVSTFLLSDSLQRARIARWNRYWAAVDVNHVVASLRREGKKLGFSDKVFDNFRALIGKEYTVATMELSMELRTGFFQDFLIEEDGLATVVTLANVAPEKKDSVYAQLAAVGISAFDRLMLTNMLAEFVHDDFNFIVMFTSVLVFVALLLSYGRIELTLITFVPMLVTWVWILGLMALFGIEFNIVNVMISTFIFGLGDDYSIFTMDGLQREYAIGKRNLPSIRTSILLSALTTISGLGVLIFAKHPALKSIAGISIIGIVCVFFMSQTLEPYLFRRLITDRTSKGLRPMTFLGMLRTAFLYTFFVVGSIVLTIIGLMLKLVPVARQRVRLLYHGMISSYTRALVWLDPQVKIVTMGKGRGTFRQSSVVIANHSSFLDILFTVMQHPKLILLTNQWVWNSPVFGGVVRLADFHPVTEGAEESVDRLRKRTEEGYSIVVFPEGTRTTDGNLKRFHKGAFFLAESLGLPVQPLLILGAGEAVPKGTFYVNPTTVYLKYLPLIPVDHHEFGVGYSERTKKISRYFKEEFEKLKSEVGGPSRFASLLISNYLYKGPVLEWYMRIKVRLEEQYDLFHKLVPTSGRVLDLGCGYGFLSYMLALSATTREVLGVDYDEEKIAVAHHGFLRPGNLSFTASDITTIPVENYDTIVILDVLHYLTPEKQESVLRRCFSALPAGGKIIIRDGDADLRERHKGTRLTELFSVKLLKFNKSENKLHFISGRRLSAMAIEHGLHVSVLDQSRLTSNVIFVISKLA